MLGRKGRARKGVAVIAPIVDAGQENVIDSTTGPINGNNKKLLEVELQSGIAIQQEPLPVKRASGRSKKTIPEPVAVAPFILPIPKDPVLGIKTKSRGRKLDSNEEVITKPVVAVKRGGGGRKKNITEANGDDGEGEGDAVDPDAGNDGGGDSEELQSNENGDSLASMKNKRESKKRTAVVKAVNKPPILEEIDEIKDEIVGKELVRPVTILTISTKKGRGKKAAAVANEMEQNNENTGGGGDDDDSAGPSRPKRGRSSKTKAQNKITESAAASIEDDKKEKQDNKKSAAKKVKASPRKAPKRQRIRPSAPTRELLANDRDDDDDDDDDNNDRDNNDDQINAVEVERKPKTAAGNK